MFVLKLEISFFGDKICDVIFEWVWLFVTPCDEGEGVKDNKKPDVIYGPQKNKIKVIALQEIKINT